MKTAIDWLIDEYFGDISNFTPDFKHHVKVAKEMEREQIIEHGVRCYSNCCGEPDRIAERESEAIYNSRYKI